MLVEECRGRYRHGIRGGHLLQRWESIQRRRAAEVHEQECVARRQGCTRLYGVPSPTTSTTQGRKGDTFRDRGHQEAPLERRERTIQRRRRGRGEAMGRQRLPGIPASDGQSGPPKSGRPRTHRGNGNRQLTDPGTSRYIYEKGVCFYHARGEVCRTMRDYPLRDAPASESQQQGRCGTDPVDRGRTSVTRARRGRQLKVRPALGTGFTGNKHTRHQGREREPGDTDKSQQQQQVWVRAQLWRPNTLQHSPDITTLLNTGAGGGNYASVAFISR